MSKKKSLTDGRMSRRTVLKAACTAGATVVAGSALRNTQRSNHHR